MNTKQLSACVTVEPVWTLMSHYILEALQKDQVHVLEDGLRNLEEETVYHHDQPYPRVPERAVGFRHNPERKIGQLFGSPGAAAPNGFKPACRIVMLHTGLETGSSHYPVMNFRWPGESKRSKQRQIHPHVVAFFRDARKRGATRAQLEHMLTRHHAGDLEISHRCHENYCIEPTHLVLEAHTNNTKRSGCKGKQGIEPQHFAPHTEADWLAQCLKYHDPPACIY